MFVRALVTPLETTRSDQGAVNRSLFLLALRGLYEYAAGGGDLSAALVSNEAVGMMLAAWRDLRVDENAPAPTVADAVQAAWLFEHMLRPLSAPVVDADIVHSSMNGLSTLVGMAAKWRNGTPLVMSEHGIYLRERYISYLHEDASHAVRVLALSFFRSLAGAAYLITDVLAPHSAYNRRWQLHNGADADRMWTMYNGVEPAEFPAATSEPDVPTISFMGRVDPLKDLHTLIRAFELVRKEIPEARLRIFGGTPAVNRIYHESCERLIAELGLDGAARLEGRIGNAVDAYHAGSIVALTSISEGFPYTVVEAMACGRPTVCTNVGGVSEAVADTGIVVAPRDHAAVAEACVKLLRDDELRHRLGVAARARVLEHFTLSQSLQMYRNVYEGLATPLEGAEAPRHLRESDGTSAADDTVVIGGAR
jgi:glycosyltransferase involved in cell wall biosynthesis